jgi:hypothetical protein
MKLGLKTNYIPKRYSGFVFDAGRYFTKTSDTSFDNMTAFTVISFISSFDADSDNYLDTLGIFYDTTNDAGFYSYTRMGSVSQHSFACADGSGGPASIVTSGGAAKFGSFGGDTNSKQDGDYIIAVINRFKAADSEKEMKTAVVGSQGISYSDKDNSASNTGAVGTNGTIRISNTVIDTANKGIIYKSSLWKSALSDADILKLCGRTETTLADSTTVDGNFRDATRFESYSDLSVTAPDHMWDFSNIPLGEASEITDTGDGTAKDLTAAGSPHIGRLLVY